MVFDTDGIVLKVQQTGEADRIVTVLTRQNGIIRAFAKGAKRLKHKLHAGTGLLCYANFSVYYNKDTYHINEAEILEVFIGLRESIEALSLAHYFCELANVFSPEGSDSQEQLRLVLNSLYMLSNKKRPPLMLKAIMELRLMSSCGYMPNLVGCDTCGTHETDSMYFDFKGSRIFCNACIPSPNCVSLPLPVISAMRHIVYSELERLYNFSLSDECCALLSDITERYIDNLVQHRFSTLDFYKSTV